jgi:hypothetical protein
MKVSKYFKDKEGTRTLFLLFFKIMLRDIKEGGDGARHSKQNESFFSKLERRLGK